MTDALHSSEFPPDLAIDSPAPAWAKGSPVVHTQEPASGGWLSQAWDLWSRPLPVAGDDASVLPADPAY